MGFFSGLAKCVGAAVVTVVAAPIVIPAAGAALAGVAAAGTAAAGAAAAAGSAVAGTAAAAGSAIAGVATSAAAAGTAAVGSVATAAAGTVVGEAAIGAAATVGSGIGSAAGAVGLSSVAAATGTTAGAAAVGTIGTSVAVGAQQGVSAKMKIDEAKEIVSDAKYRYKKSKTVFDGKQSEVNKNIQRLADIKKRVADKIIRYNELLEKIENPSRLEMPVINENKRGKNMKEVNYEGYAVTAKEFANGILKSYAGGQLASIALSGGITSTITAAGTGTAMSALSGAAATNATMAALGGGTLASGGLGMAGGAVIANGLAFAPALAIGGFLLNSKAGDALKEAKRIDRESDKAISQFEKVGLYYQKLSDNLSLMSDNIEETEKLHDKEFAYMKLLITDKKQADANNWSDEDVQHFYASVGLVKVLELQCRQEFTTEDAKVEDFDEKNVVSVNTIKQLKYDKIPKSQFSIAGKSVADCVKIVN